MDKIVLKSAYFKQLKGLYDVDITFSNALTAIMGVNGSGKTTVIHALACSFNPIDSKLHRFKFPSFFIPNSDSLWKGSEFTLNYTVNDIAFSKTYKKSEDRWAPRYEKHPSRNVHYIGIETCLPEIEKITASSRIMYKSAKLIEKKDEKIIKDAAYILNKDYDMLLDNEYSGKHLIGVKLGTGLKYSSLSMGTGEQRVIKILKTLSNVDPYSLVLIDEIDLLLHVSALRRLITKLHNIAITKHIQIVFTTHSTEMVELYDYVKIQYLSTQGNHTVVYDHISTELIHDLTGHHEQPYSIYVEDRLAKTIISKLIKKNKMASKISVITYGSIENAFTLAAGLTIAQEPDDKTLIVLDGDKYITTDEKSAKIKNKLSGTEKNITERRNQALGYITQFNLPEGNPPELFINNIIKESFPDDSIIKESAIRIKAVKDSHEWINLIFEETGLNENDLVDDLFSYAYDNQQFQDYLSNILNWIQQLPEYQNSSSLALSANH